jgi:asparagine synthase (glutamine-hydrolysing)
MSVITGLWHFDGAPLDKERLAIVAGYARQHGPDSRTTEFHGSIGMIYQMFDSGTKVSRGPQPHRSESGSTMMWDGRLDNRDDILAALDSRDIQRQDADGCHVPSDIEILHALYNRYGVESFSRIIGDWALCIWDPSSKRLTMACDFVGIRHLYYCNLQNAVLWCSDLGALVRGAGRSFAPNDAYIAEYLEAMPHPSRTPYEGVEALPPGHWVEITETKSVVHRYWTWDISRPIRYKSDEEYEEHFRHELRRSVSRRLQSDYPVMAELSGGLDSSSIVCTADDILNSEGAATPALHTLSYYHDEEPSCDERPYFSVIEGKRGRSGTHINSARYETLTMNWPTFIPVPIYPHGVIEAETELREVLQRHSARTILSGLGGDEFLGGVPTGIPELADLLRARALTNFCRSLGQWSRVHRSSRWELLSVSLGAALTLKLRDVSVFTSQRTSILSDSLAKYSRSGRVQKANSIDWMTAGSTPTQRMFVEAWCGLQRQCAHMHLPLYGTYQRTYPCLDRDLLSFLFNIPRTQIIRAGERRSLMRRSLGSLVPREILWRKNKATSVRRYMKLFSQYATEIRVDALGPASRLCQEQFIHSTRAEIALSQAINGIAAYNWPVMRMIGLHSWFKASRDYISPPFLVSKGHRGDSSGLRKTSVNYEHREPYLR